jgi:hypothetical protein
MFDVSPFQSSPDMSVQARWSNAMPPLQSVPMSMPFAQQGEGSLPSQFNHGTPADPSLTANKFPSESRTMSATDSSCNNFPVTTNSNVSQLPDELGLVDSSSGEQNTIANNHSSSASNVVDVGKTVVAPDSVRIGRSTNSSYKPQSSHQQNNMGAQQQYGYQRGGGGGFSQKNEWSHRRTGGFQGRNNQPMGADNKGFAPSKMKQIYVAKQPTPGTSTTS